MILGYLMPDNERYSINWEPKGKLKLEKNEKIIQKANEIQINFAKYGWDKKFDLDYGFDKGIGKLIKTNKRLIYKRKIDPNSSFRFWNFAPSAITEMWYAKKLKKQNINEYFEFYFDEIRGYEELKFLWIKGLGIYVSSIEKISENTIKNYFAIVFSDKYKIINDPKILKKEITEDDYEKMRKEYKDNLKK